MVDLWVLVVIIDRSWVELLVGAYFFGGCWRSVRGRTLVRWYALVL